MSAMTILLADDDKQLLKALSVRCRLKGLKIITAEDGVTALGKAEAVIPDLAVLDVRMPSGNGLAICQMMSRDERLRDVPVVILTGLEDDEIRLRCKNLRAHYVCKGDNVWGQIEPWIDQLLPAPVSSE